MPVIEVEGIGDYHEPDVLKGRYGLKAGRVNVAGLNLAINWEIIDGEPTADGQSVMGREIVDFQPIVMKETWKESYKIGQTKKRNALFQAAGVELGAQSFETEEDFQSFMKTLADEFIGSEVEAVVGPGKDQYDVPRDEVKRYLGPYNN